MSTNENSEPVTDNDIERQLQNQRDNEREQQRKRENAEAAKRREDDAAREKKEREQRRNRERFNQRQHRANWIERHRPFHDATDPGKLPDAKVFNLVAMDGKPPNLDELSEDEQNRYYDAPPRSWYVWGKTGAGKTRAAWEWLRRFADEDESYFDHTGNEGDDNTSIAFRECDAVFRELSYAARDEDRREEIMTALADAEYLVLDDLGHTLSESNARALLEIIKARHDKRRNKQTVITSQFSIKGLKLRLGRGNMAMDAVCRRLVECFTPVCFGPVAQPPPDRRPPATAAPPPMANGEATQPAAVTKGAAHAG